MGTDINNGIATTHLNTQRGQKPYLSIERLRKYLYKVTFDRLTEDESNESPISGACSAFVRDGKLYRNLDFKYDNAASFIIRTRDFEGMSFMTGLNDGDINDSMVAQLPYRIVDGRNNYGIMVSTHVLFNDWQWTGSGDKSISLTRLPYLVLSKVKSMATISDDLEGVLDNLYASEGLLTSGYLLQILVTDGTSTYALLPPGAEGQGYVLQDITSNPKMTNFRWVGRESVARTESDIQARPTGVERWNMMPCNLSDLRFTAAYEQDSRLSEFIGLRHTTKDSTDEELEAIYDDARTEYLNRERDGKTWHTMHSVVYGEGMESLFIQEDWTDDIIALSDISNAVNELVDIMETEELVVSLEQSTSVRKMIYDKCLAHPQIAKNIVVLGSDGLYYVVNGYGMVSDVLHLHTIMQIDGTMQDVLLRIASNGSISV